MEKIDLLQRFIFENIPIRGELVHLEDSLETILNQHPYPSSVRKLLGEALCVAGLLSAVIKFNGRLTVQFRGNGKLKLLLAQCDNHFNLRGLAKWDGDMTYADLMESFNEGVLVIMLDSGAKSQYQGIVSWRGNSLVDSIEGYFKESEQLNTKIWLEMKENSATGMLLQMIPSSAKELSSLEKDFIDNHWDRITSHTNFASIETSDEFDVAKLLKQLYPDEDIRIFSPNLVKFQCTCSRKRSEDAISMIGREEAEAELQDKQMIVVTCDFCNTEYIFDKTDISKIFDKNDIPPSKLH